MLGVCGDTKAPPMHKTVVYVKAGLHKMNYDFKKYKMTYDFKVSSIMTYDLPR